ncbi:unnamed protein product, partial [Mesorhabditis spiculigera]
MKSGGFFLAAIPNYSPESVVWTEEEARKFGAANFYDQTQAWQDGIEATIKFYDKEHIGTATCALWLKSTYQQLFEEAGFIDIKFNPATIAEEGLKELGREYFHDFLNPPKDFFVTARKQ